MRAGSQMLPTKYRVLLFMLAFAVAATAHAASAPVVDSFVASPPSPVPGQNVTLTIQAHDPDCTAAPCTTACGTAIRSDLLVWSDDTGRTTGAFTGSTPAPTGSPWSATVTWIAPAAEGTYTVRASLSDNGGMLCGGKQTRVATLQLVVSSAPAPSITSCTVVPQTLMVGESATISATASDPLNRPLEYAFAADAGTIAQTSPQASTATWTAPASAGTIGIRCTATAAGMSASLQTTATVQIGSYLRTLTTPDLRATRVATLPDGRIVAVDGANGVLAALTPSGGVSWRVTGLSTPVGVASAGSEIFVLERASNRISVWSTGGTRVREIPIVAAMPNQLAIGPGAGELSLSDTGAARILVISSRDGQLLRTIGDGMLQAPAGLAASYDRIAVADPPASRVLLFTADGTLTATLGDSTLLVRPQGLAWDLPSRRLLVSDSFSGEVVILGEDNVVRGTVGGFGTSAGKLVNPIDVALLPGGTVAVTTGSGDVPTYRILTTLPPLSPATALAAADRAGDDGGAIDVSWTKSVDDPARVTAYRVERATGSDESFTVMDVVAKGTTRFADASARDGVCYRYRVVATDGASDAPTDPTSCTIARNDLAPPAPVITIAKTDSPFSASFEWTAVTVPDLGGYVLEITHAGTVVGSRSVSATSLAWTGLTADTTYDVALRAVDTAGNASVAATATIRTYPDAGPPAPASVAAVDRRTGGSMDVTWSAVESTIPVAKYRVDCVPSVAGWPSRSLETTATTIPVDGLVNELEYRVTVIAVTPWDRAGDPSAAVAVTPTRPRFELPVVAATDPVQDAAGIEVSFAIDADRRELRFQYRALATTLAVTLDGSSLGSPLPDTAGQWSEATVTVDKRLLKSESTHVLGLRSTAFPNADAQLSLQRVDFVPLTPRGTAVSPFNTVADVTWQWDEGRKDLGVALVREDVTVRCGAPQLGRCRDTFLENDREREWMLRAVSPAGWMSDAVRVHGRAKYSEGPPAITDAIAELRGDSIVLSWTPVSSAASATAPAVAVKSYRVYAAGTLVLELPAPPAIVRGVDPATIVVRAVDAEGRESQ